MGLARLITQASRVVYIIVVARVLGAESYGSLNVALAWTLSFLPLATLGLGAYILAELSIDKASSRRVLAQTLSLTLLASLVTAIAAAWIGLAVESDPVARQLICLFSAAIMARGIVRWTEVVFLAYERPVYTLRQEATFRVLEVACVAVIVLAGGEASDVAAASLTCWWLQALAGLRVVRDKLIDHPLSLGLPTNGALLASVIPLLLIQLFSEGLLQYPIVLAHHLIRDAHVIGNVALAMQALFVVSLAPYILAHVARPALVRSRARADGRDRYFIEALCRVSVIGTSLLVVSAAALGPPLVSLLLGSQYAVAGQLLWLSMLVLWPLSVNVILGSWLLAARRYRFAAFSSSIALLVLLLSSTALIPWLGPTGVFIAAALGQVAGALTRLIALLAEQPGIFDHRTRDAFVIAVASALGYALWHLVGWPPLAGAVLALALLVAASLRRALTADERGLLFQSLAKTARLARPAKRAMDAEGRHSP
jgi:O-antigen/teichoic acid export membrane protein